MLRGALGAAGFKIVVKVEVLKHTSLWRDLADS